MCHATNLRLVAGRKYRIRLDMDDGIEGDWFDKARHTDVAGFAADDWRHFLASPLKRWWRENWFQPIARIGETGNYEHVLQGGMDRRRCVACSSGVQGGTGRVR